MSANSTDAARNPLVDFSAVGFGQVVDARAALFAITVSKADSFAGNVQASATQLCNKLR